MTGDTKYPMPLRPHHLYCDLFGSWDFSERGKAFVDTEHKIKITLSTPEALIEVVQGPDILCQVCPDYRNNRCQSPRGNEDQVRKWDGILIRELGIDYGTVLTPTKLKALASSKAPLTFCQNRCRRRATCPGSSKRQSA